MQDGSWYYEENAFGATAACYLENGSKQGCPCSPDFFITDMDSFLRMASATGLGWRPSDGTPMFVAGRPIAPEKAPSVESDPSTAFVDDLNLVTCGPKAKALAHEIGRAHV